MITAAQQIERQARMGASDAAIALGLSPFGDERTLRLEKTGRLEPDRGTKSTRAGQFLEPSILDVAESELGELKRGEVVFAPNADFPLASTLDARVVRSGLPVEAKSTGIVGPVYGEWGDEGTDVVPPYYLVQTTVQMICTQTDLAHLYALIGGRGIVRYEIRLDEQLAAEIVERLARWWDRHIVQDIEPASSEPLPLEVVKRIRRQPNKVIELYGEDLATVAEYEQANTLALSAEKTKKAAQSKLLMLLGDAEAATLPDGRELTYLETHRKGYVVADTSYRTLRIKKGK